MVPISSAVTMNADEIGLPSQMPCEMPLTITNRNNRTCGETTAQREIS